MKSVSLFCLCAVFTSLYASGPGSVTQLSKHDLESSEVKGAAQAVVDLLYRGFKTFHSVIKGTEQIVEGIKYVLTILVGLSTCEVGKGPCIDTEETMWNATVLYHAWRSPKYEVVRWEQIMQNGALTAAAQVVVTGLNKMSNSYYKTVLINVWGVPQDGDEYILYSLVMKVGVSNCLNDGQLTTPEQCPVHNNGMEEMWKAVVQEHIVIPTHYEVISMEKIS